MPDTTSHSLTGDDLPPIPSKKYFTIGEVSELCDVKTHVLRYWEQEFPQLKPVKRRGNRRYYQRHDVLMVRQIRSLLYDHGFTIGGARQQLISATASAAAAATAQPVADPAAPKIDPAQRRQIVQQLRGELEQVLQELKRRLH